MNKERYAMQRTVADTIPLAGVGLHTGQRATLLIHPAAADTGIVFLRADLGRRSARVPATWDNVIDTRRCTVIGNGREVTVSTIEHLMAAFSGCHVDNALVEINGPEVPIFDGSAAFMVTRIRAIGTIPQDAPRRAIRVRAPVRVSLDDRWACMEPAAAPRVSVRIRFGASAVGEQEFALDLNGNAFDRELSRARTFGFLSDIENMRDRGLGTGGSLANALIVDEDRVLNPDGLRFPDEFARHKALDCVGDLYLAGAPVLGHLRSFKPGHVLNHALSRELMRLDHAWERINLRESGWSTPLEYRFDQAPCVSYVTRDGQTYRSTATDGHVHAMLLTPTGKPRRANIRRRTWRL